MDHLVNDYNAEYMKYQNPEYVKYFQYYSKYILEHPNEGNTSLATLVKNNIYPNPNSGSFTIDIPSTSQITILNTLGQIIYSEKLNSGKHDKIIKELSNWNWMRICLWLFKTLLLAAELVKSNYQ